MDITIHPVSGVTQAYQAPTVKTPATGSDPSSSAPAPQETTTPVSPVPATDTVTTASISQQYEAAARQAELSFKNVYALSDQDFSIFKDATGKYITRYVSLRDGKVTYSPAPTYVRPSAIGSGHVAISA